MQCKKIRNFLFVPVVQTIKFDSLPKNGLHSINIISCHVIYCRKFPYPFFTKLESRTHCSLEV